MSCEMWNNCILFEPVKHGLIKKEYRYCAGKKDSEIYRIVCRKDWERRLRHDANQA